jgi:outer membrane protein assembly factor BamB
VACRATFLAAHHKSRAAAILLGAVFLFLPPRTAALDWPQFRGPGRDGSVPGLAPHDWPAELPLLWQRSVGEGYSGPVVSGNRIWIHTRRAGSEVVASLDLSTGDTLWSRQYPAPFRQDHDALAHGHGPYATPSLAGGRLFTVGVRSVLSVWDAASGDLLWRKASTDEFDPGFPFFGMASSPLVWRDLCFIHLGGHQRSNINVPGKGAMVAYRASDGREIWRWEGDAPAMGASPVIHTIDGQPQLIFKTKKQLAGLDPRTGAELWRIPYKVTMDNTISTPLFVGNRLITSDYDTGLTAWEIRSNADAWTILQVWNTRSASLFMNSPVSAAGLLIGFSHFRQGHLFLLEPTRGRVLWRGPPRAGEHATLLAWGNHVLVFHDDGSLTVGKVSPQEIRPIRRYHLGDAAAWAPAAVSGNHLIVKAGSRLAVYQLPAPELQ